MNNGVGRLYVLCSANTQDVYVGKTRRTLSARFKHHKYAYKSYLADKGSAYCTAYEIIAQGGLYIVLLEEHSHISDEELTMRERYYILHTGRVVNHNIPGGCGKYNTPAVLCVCGVTRRGNRIAHEASAHHVKYIEQLAEELYDPTYTDAPTAEAYYARLDAAGLL